MDRHPAPVFSYKRIRQRISQRRADRTDIVAKEYDDLRAQVVRRFEGQFLIGSNPDTIKKWKARAAAQGELALVGERAVSGEYDQYESTRYKYELLDAVHVYASAYDIPESFETERAELVMCVAYWLHYGINPFQEGSIDILISPSMLVAYTQAVSAEDLSPTEEEIEAVAQHYSRNRLAYFAVIDYYHELEDLGAE